MRTAAYHVAAGLGAGPGRMRQEQLRARARQSGGGDSEKHAVEGPVSSIALVPKVMVR